MYYKLGWMAVQEATASAINATTSPSPAQVAAMLNHRSMGPCLTFVDVLIAFVVITLIMATIVGNMLVCLAIVLYAKMRTFTNILLMSLSTADLLVGILIMPISTVNMLYDHTWVFGRVMCGGWATLDTLLCTASILNLCVISLDRYFAITSPLHYTRKRTRRLAAVLLTFVWVASLIISSPPWFVPGWGLFDTYDRQLANWTRRGHPANDVPLFVCEYSQSIYYRVYSACGSFYIPMTVMLFVYARIFHVADEREKMVGKQQRGHPIRFSIRRKKSPKSRPTSQDDLILNHNVTRPSQRKMTVPANHRLTAVPCKERGTTTTSVKHDVTNDINNAPAAVHKQHRQLMEITRSDTLDDSDGSAEMHAMSKTQFDRIPRPSMYRSRRRSNTEHMGNSSGTPACQGSMEEENSLIDLEDEEPELDTFAGCPKQSARSHSSSNLSSSGAGTTPSNLVSHARQQMKVATKQPSNMLKHAKFVASTYNRTTKVAREKAVYARERKALKTIGMIVCGFVICWLPFFVLYLVDVLFDTFLRNHLWLFEVFLFLGYSNSALNPIIYTFCNGDFRRCFRDLLSCGCIRFRDDRRRSLCRPKRTPFY